MARRNYESCNDDACDRTTGPATARRNYGRNYEGCGPQYFRDVADYEHDYVDDWNYRFDDAEGSTRNAFSSLFGNRGGRRRYIEDRPPRAMRRGIGTEDILEEAGFYEVLEKVEKLTKQVEELTKA